jgi:hypothetical protein
VAGLTPQWSAVPPEVARAFRTVSAALSASDFYLAGGTALALRIGHRSSVDLDLFSPTLRNVDQLIAQLLDVVPDFAVTSTAPRTLYGTLEGVQVSFFGYAYPCLAPPERPDPSLLAIATIEDIAAMKLAAIASRGSRKDFVDLWFLIRGGLPLAETVRLFERKYAAIDVGHVVRSLTYFDDAELEPGLRMLRPAPWATVKDDMRSWVEELLAAS